MDAAPALLIFLGLAVATFAGWRAVVWLVEGNPRVVEDGFTTKGGGWVGGRQATWPFVELHVTPDVIELRPRHIGFIRTTVLDRSAVCEIWRPLSPFGRGLRFERFVGGPITFWPARNRATTDALRQLAWDIECPIEVADPAGHTHDPGPAAGGPIELPPASRTIPGSATCYRPGPLLYVFVVPWTIAVSGVTVMLGPLGLVVAVGLFAVADRRVAIRASSDGHTLTLRSLLWRRRVPLSDIVEVESSEPNVLPGGGQLAVALRNGTSRWVLVLSSNDRVRYQQFLAGLVEDAPWIKLS